MSFIFESETRYINTIVYKKNWGAPRKNTVVFVADSKKTATQKTRFFPLGRNFGFRLLKKRPQIVDRGPPTSKLFFHEISIKTLGVARNFGRGPPHRDFMPFFRKIVLDIFFPDFYCDLPRKLVKSRILKQKNMLFCELIEISGISFRNRVPKSSISNL